MVINAGSSSLKYQLLDMETEEMLAKGNCERIGMEEGIFSHKTADGRKLEDTLPMADHGAAFKKVTAALCDKDAGVIESLDEISAIGHRVVQGGSLFSHSVLVDDEVIAGIESLIPLAPLHNKPELDAILACRELFGPTKPQCVVFDTSFHATMPPKAYLYAIPYSYYEKYQIRRYGFHGTSHRYVSQKCAEMMNAPLESLRIITCHIGNGSSITAIKDGKVIDTSMGLTPLDGFMMGTRSGSLDPSVVTFIMEKEGLNPKQMDEMLNKQSGLLGVSGISSDDRDIEQAESEGHERAILSHEMLGYQITKTIGGYVAALGGLDCLVFTAGLGENQVNLRREVCASLSYLGMKIDESANEEMRRGNGGVISSLSSNVAVFVIPTNEELVIARDTKAIVENL
ncbi:acetate kinase [Clostridia bacterium OttesenSCG-928-O13]|nr:acetate kinase [Clostridia bacterium OttesenSCG-928-O13]